MRDRKNGVTALVVAVAVVMSNAFVPGLVSELHVPVAMILGLISGYALGSILD